MKRGRALQIAGISSWPYMAGTVRGTSRQPWSSRAVGSAARISVLQMLLSRILQRGRRLKLGKTHRQYHRPACVASAFGDRIPQVSAGHPD